MPGVVGFIFVIILIIATSERTPIPEKISPAEFVNLVEHNQVFASSGNPLERFTNKATGQQYLRGSYYTFTGQRHPVINFQVPVSEDSHDEVMTVVRKAGFEVIKASDSEPLSPAVRSSIILALLGPVKVKGVQ
jgi:hypothetical protein